MSFSSASRLLLLSTGMLAISACASSARQEELAYVERPVEVLYNEATGALDRRLWDEAALRFAEVQRQHPYSIWAQRSLLMTAYAHYKSSNFDECISSAQEYIALHPGAEGAPYAYYLIGVSNFDQIIDVGREQARSELALAALNEVVRRFPQSEYAKDAELKLDMVRDQLAGKEMEIGRFYLRRNEQLAAVNRFRNVIEKYDTTTHTPEALHRLVEAYLTIGLTGQAQAAGAVLGYNYPDSVWYRDTYALLTSQGVTPEVKPDGDEGWLARTWKRIF
ncbi:outer membrane protein assembly factor BamD [bacterium]|nr:outer membrane protein assembly factor BamD [bacterium]